MQVTSGAEWSLPSGNRREYAVGFDSNDGRSIFGEEAWDSWSWAQQLKKLQQSADLAVLAYMHQEGAISAEMFQTRMAQVKAS